MNQKKKALINSLFPLNFLIILILLSVVTSHKLNAQTEMEPWGNITGIRINGQLMKFESSLSVVGKDWSKITSTGKEKQRPKYHREGSTQIVSTNIDSLYFNEKIQDLEKGKAIVDIMLTSRADATIAGTYFSIELIDDYASGSIQIDDLKATALSTFNNGNQEKIQNGSAKTILLTSKQQQLKITMDVASVFTLKKDAKSGRYLVYLPMQEGDVKNGQTFNRKYTIESFGKIDNQPINLLLNASKQGREFAGFGGNFRIQNPKTDPQVIDYSLQNLRVAWSRIEMPWRFWQPQKDVNALEEAKAGKLNPRVQSAMEMAQRLNKMNIPVILSAWSGPDWAIEGKPNFRPTPEGIWGNKLNQNNITEIYNSITNYILYIKEHYGFEIKMFSFNESDLGINIRQTGQEHAEFIKGLGAYFKSKGLKTQLLLGDNSDANTIEFIEEAIQDPETKPYIGAISFHSWRGWETETLKKWADAATKLNIPLIVGEGSIDAAAWNYPAIFAEPTYALQEINLYTRLLAICQPLSILQWQLTADYSPLAGGGIFGDTGPLRPTQRFWNLKQLASTPKNVFSMPITADQSNLSCAALGNNETGVYTIHMVNNGTTRKVTLTGLPKKTKAFKIYVTDQKRSVSQGKRILVTNGKAIFNLDSQAYTTLISD